MRTSAKSNRPIRVRLCMVRATESVVLEYAVQWSRVLPAYPLKDSSPRQVLYTAVSPEYKRTNVGYHQ